MWYLPILLKTNAELEDSFSSHIEGITSFIDGNQSDHLYAWKSRELEPRNFAFLISSFLELSCGEVSLSIYSARG